MGGKEESALHGGRAAWSARCMESANWLRGCWRRVVPISMRCSVWPSTRLAHPAWCIAAHVRGLGFSGFGEYLSKIIKDEGVYGLRRVHGFGRLRG
eukprot:30321-Chlamydomonas_euryale.AAC.2